ncbi:MAG: ECF transporter S component [Clostridia bacterium]|jgi:uncharacterized membrane protein|nr:ECF transporter S component [Clostridia bacterium]
MKYSTKQLVAGGLMAALVVVGTMLIQIPTPTKGYIHLGDSMVYLCGALLGPWVGGLAAAVGSLLADLFSGYGIYAPATFVIKGLDALIVGLVFSRFASRETSLVKKGLGFTVAFILGGMIMAAGYLAYETFLYGFGVAVLGVPGNILQAAGGGIIALLLLLTINYKYRQNL